VTTRPGWRSETGLTLIETMIVAAATLPILVSVLGTTLSVGKAVDVTSQVAALEDHIDQVIDRFGRLCQKAVATTLRTRATKVDVDAAAADPLVIDKPKLGDWIVPQDFLDRSSLQFHAVRGDLSFNAKDTEGPFSFELELEAGEKANGIDDDGDGLIDEGRVLLQVPAAVTTVLPRVESLTVTVEGSLVTVRLVGARPDKQKHIHRITRIRKYQIRNL